MDNEFNLEALQGWNSKEVDENFFNDEKEDVGTTATEVVETISKDEEKDKKEDEEAKKEKEIEDTIFNDDPNPDAEEVETPKTATVNSKKESSETVSKDTSSTVSAVKLLIDKGLVNYEPEEDEELDEDKANELLEEGFHDSVEDRVKELLGELPNEVQALNKFVLNGGNAQDFFSKTNTIGNSKITQKLDMSNETNQELVVRQMYLNEGMDEDFIDTQIESLKDTGKLEAFSKKRFEKWKEQDANRIEEEVEIQRQKAEEQRAQARKNVIKLKNNVSNFNTMKLSAKDKNEIPSYMTDRNIKLNNGSQITKFNKDLLEVLENETASVQLAKILRDRNKDGLFDFSSIEKSVTTKVTKEVKDNLRRNKQTIPNSSVEIESSTKSLADYF